VVRETIALFSPFENQSHVAHALLVGAGFAAFVGGTYLAAILVYDGTAILFTDGSDAVAARRVCLAIGMIACYVVFTVGVLRATGGLMLNLAGYPLIMLTLGTGWLYPALFGGAPEVVFTDALRLTPMFTRHVGVMVLPGMVIATVTVIVAAHVGFDSEEEEKAWMERHLSEAFLEAYNDEYEDGEWIDGPSDSRP